MLCRVGPIDPIHELVVAASINLAEQTHSNRLTDGPPSPSRPPGLVNFLVASIARALLIALPPSGSWISCEEPISMVGARHRGNHPSYGQKIRLRSASNVGKRVGLLRNEELDQVQAESEGRGVRPAPGADLRIDVGDVAFDGPDALVLASQVDCTAAPDLRFLQARITCSHQLGIRRPPGTAGPPDCRPRS
jgi:hypothetical protein